jgi:hypothetical protein
MNESIFVQISAYRDPELAHTLDSLFREAAVPSRLRVCVCWQHGPGERIPESILKGRSIEVIPFDFAKSKGANWARRIVQKRWRDEEFSLIVDSHLRFAPKWDRWLIAKLRWLEEQKVEKPILTCYPPNFEVKKFQKRKSRIPLKIYKEAYHQNMLLHFAGFPLPLWKWLKEPIRAEFLALGLLFSRGSFNREIPLDPRIYFFGDEITTGLRAYTSGYDFFHPHRVIAWHLYDRKSRTAHWDDHPDWRMLDRKSYRRVKRLFQGRAPARFPLGKARTVRQYEKLTGLKLILPA